jgi:ATP-binding cassette subfamily B protein
LLTSSFLVVGMIYVTAAIDLQLALVALVVSPVLLVVLRVYGRRIRRCWHGTKALESYLLFRVQELLSAARVVKAFGQERMEEERFAHHSGENVGRHRRLALLQAQLSLAIGLTTAAGSGIVLFIGVHHVLAGTLTLGSLLLVMGYLVQLYKPLEDMSQKSADLQDSLASAERAMELLDQTPEVPEKPGARRIERAKGAVTFCDVSFAYREGSPVLHDVSFEVEPGTRVGISGTTGAGKSTLMNLLTRFYDPTSGRILLDGVDLRDYKLADLRNQFAIVLQEPVLFSNSIAENIAYARPDASEEEIVEAAKAANAHEFITSLPGGYETEVGERGMSLSGGERQRIALARAFLKDAPILILDEPTSSVDTKTEAAIMEAMERLMRGRTAFMIAHRLGTLASCEARLEIEDGRVVKFEQLTLAAGASKNVTKSPHRSEEIS